MKKLLSLTPNLTTYQSGPKAPSQIIADGKYVLKDSSERKKFEADLRFFITSLDSQGRSRLMSTKDITPDLVKFLEVKGYQQRNIENDFKARIITPDPDGTRRDLQALSNSTDDFNLEQLLAKLNDPQIDRFSCEQWSDQKNNPLFELDIINKEPVSSYIAGLTVRRAFAELLTGKKTFSPELINSIAEEEKFANQLGNDDDVFRRTRIKPDGGPEHIQLVFDRLLQLQSCLEYTDGGNRSVRNKIEAAIPFEQSEDVRVRIDGPGRWRSFFPDSVKPDVNLRPLLEIFRPYPVDTIYLPEGLGARDSLINHGKVDDKRNFYKSYEPGTTLKMTFAELLTGKKTFSPELINSIAAVEKSGDQGRNDSDVFKDTGIKPDGGPKHIAFILERLSDLQACLREQFKEDQHAVAKITAAIPTEQLVNMRKALNVTT